MLDSSISQVYHGKDQIQEIFYGKTRIWEDSFDKVIIIAKPEIEINGKTLGSGRYDPGSNVRIEAIPNPGWVFKQWSNGIKSRIQIITANEDTTFIAFFEKNLGIINYKENYK